MQLNRTKNVVKNKLKALQKSALKIPLSYNPDTIHLFRVQIKKLRSFLQVLNYKLPANLKKLYLAAGEVRTIQLQQKEINEDANADELIILYYSSLKEELEKSKIIFSGILATIDFRAEERRLKHKIPSDITSKRVRNHLKSEISALLIFAAVGLSTDDDVHSIRKKMKNINYMNSLFRNGKKNKNSGFLGKAASRKLQLLATELGEFVDKAVAISMLPPLPIAATCGKAGNALFSLRILWAKQKEIMREHLAHEITAPDFQKLFSKSRH